MNERRKEKPIVAYSKRERRTAKHLATFTPSALEELTNVAEASGVSRNEAILQACDLWIEEKRKDEKRVKVTISLDDKQVSRINKLARLKGVTKAELLTELVKQEIYKAEEQVKKRVPLTPYEKDEKEEVKQ